MPGGARSSRKAHTAPGPDRGTEGAAGRAAVDRYLAAQSPAHRRSLEHLRELIQTGAPEATELISYGMPAFRQEGMLVYYAAFRDHLSFFVGGPKTRERFAEELRPFTVGKATVRFSPEHPLPDRLVLRIVRARVAENRARRAARSRRGPRPAKAR